MLAVPQPRLGAPTVRLLLASVVVCSPTLITSSFSMPERSRRHGLVPSLRELITIIAGVLIALALDNWNDGRRDRALEAQYLTALEADLRSDSVAFQTLFMPMLARKDSALSVVASVVRGAPLTGDTFPFLQAVGLGGLLGTNNPIILTRRATYDELLATGNLSLIRSQELRAALVKHYMNADVRQARMLARVANYPLFVHKYYPAELRSQITPAAVRRFGLRRAIKAFRSPEFEALMDQEFNASYFLKAQLEEGLQETDGMLRKVEAARADAK